MNSIDNDTIRQQLSIDLIDDQLIVPHADIHHRTLKNADLVSCPKRSVAKAELHSLSTSVGLLVSGGWGVTGDNAELSLGRLGGPSIAAHEA
jgi:hypothetical protein